MTARRLDGQELSKIIRAEIADRVRELVRQGEPVPGLAAILVGENPASEVYVRNKRKACESVGIASWLYRFPKETPQEELLAQIERLNRTPEVSGILVQLPLPSQIEESSVIRAIDPLKDVDAFHPENLGLLTAGHPRYLPCTPFGVQQMLSRSGIPTRGASVVILGRSNIVGKPLSLILMQKPSPVFPEAGDATVTVVHRGTQNLSEICRQADILISAIGVPHFVKPEMIRPGGVVIDVGINTLDGKIVGDVHPSVSEVALWLSPVPGGVGPMTITMLLDNTFRASRLLRRETV